MLDPLYPNTLGICKKMTNFHGDNRRLRSGYSLLSYQSVLLYTKFNHQSNFLFKPIAADANAHGCNLNGYLKRFMYIEENIPTI